MTAETIEKKIKMVFRRARRGFRLVATHEPAAHESTGRQRFDGHERAATTSCRDAACVLRLSFQRNALAMVFARRADVVADRPRREGRPRALKFVGLAR